MKRLDLEEITACLPDIFNEYAGSNVITHYRLLRYNGSTLYMIIFTIHDPDRKDSIKFDFSYRIRNYIKKAICHNNLKRLYITVPAPNESAYNIFIDVKRINDSEIFSFDEIDVETNIAVTINKLCDIIKKAGAQGITKSELCIRTRYMLGRHERENFIQKLISDSKIKESETGTARKRQKVYVAV